MKYTCYNLHESLETVIEPSDVFNSRDTNDLVANIADVIVSNDSYDYCLVMARIHGEQKLKYTIKDNS